MSQRGRSDSVATEDAREAKRALIMLADSGIRFTPWVALELARMLAHIAGGDGRGVYRIVRDPE